MPTLLLCLFISNGFAKDVTVTSPDKNIVCILSASGKGFYYNVFYKEKLLVKASKLGLTFKQGGTLDKGVIDGRVMKKTSAEDYALPIGKASHVHDVYNQLIVPVKEQSGLKRRMAIEIRVFNDGLAFRYALQAQNDEKLVQLTAENTAFNMAENPLALTLFRENYTTSHEGIYDKIKLNDIKPDTLMDLPALFKFPGSVYMAITEANLHDYPGMYLLKHDGVLQSTLSPLPGQTEIKAKLLLPHYTPWRVMMIGSRMGTLIESNILTDLNEPLKDKDTSWLKPGKTTFPWWNGNVVPDTSFAPGNNYETNMYYVNFCAKNNLSYHTVVEYGLKEWYVNDGIGFEPGPHADPSKAVPLLDMQKLCDSAKALGVGIRVWVHFKALYPNLEKTFDQYEKWGIKGLMCDFMDRDDQEMVNAQEEILQSAARHRLHIQFHGAYKPTGENRTYPNMFTREGTLNYENDKWGKRVTPDADINIPFTRGLAGSTDYHLGGFRAANLNTFKVHYTAPMVMGTRCHMLAMYVVLENEQGMVCDYPDAYIGQPGFEFLKAVPVTWDETKAIAANIGEYVTIARRKGNDWYVGSITDNKPRHISTPLNFLDKGTYTAEIYSDSPDDNVNPNHLIKKIFRVNNTSVINAEMVAGGGQVMHIYKNN